VAAVQGALQRSGVQRVMQRYRWSVERRIRRW
jgi:hypothetical protein